MKAKHIILAVVMMVMLAGPAQADFILTGTQYLEITNGSEDPESHSVGILFDTSTVMVINGYISNAYVNDEAILSVQRADHYGTLVNKSAIGTARIYNTGRIELTSGHVSYLSAYDTSTVDISGGRVGRLTTMGSSTVDISGGNISGNLYAEDSSTVDISGGKMSYLYTYDNSSVNISGGLVDRAGASGFSSITFYGYDFRATGGLQLIGEEVLGTGILVGKWDGEDTEWMTTIGYQASGVSIRAVVMPEPVTLALLLLGSLALLRRRRIG